MLPPGVHLDSWKGVASGCSPSKHSFIHSLILQTRKEDLLSVQFSWAGGGAGPDTPQAVFLSWTGRPHRAMP